MDNQLFQGLEVKEGAIVHKYISAAGYQIDAGDAETKGLISPQNLVKMQIKMIEVMGNAVVFKAILVRTPVL